jgi:hypothetical protein
MGLTADFWPGALYRNCCVCCLCRDNDGTNRGLCARSDVTRGAVEISRRCLRGENRRHRRTIHSDGRAAIFALSSLLHYSVRVHFPKGFRDVSNSASREGLKVARLMMVLSSISPLFLLWAIRGSKLLPDRYLVRMQGAPPPNGWFVRYVSGMEGKQDINRGD